MARKKHVHIAFSTILLLIAKEFAISISINGRDGAIEHIPAMTCSTVAKMNEPDIQQSKQVSRDSLMSEKSPFQSEHSSVILFMLEMLKRKATNDEGRWKTGADTDVNRNENTL